MLVPPAGGSQWKLSQFSTLPEGAAISGRGSVHGRLECRSDGLLALAGTNGVADCDDGLAGPREPHEAVGARLARRVIEPLAYSRVRQELSRSGPPADAPVERFRRRRPKAEAVVRPGRDHD